MADCFGWVTGFEGVVSPSAEMGAAAMPSLLERGLCSLDDGTLGWKLYKPPPGVSTVGLFSQFLKGLKIAPVGMLQPTWSCHDCCCCVLVQTLKCLSLGAYCNFTCNGFPICSCVGLSRKDQCCPRELSEWERKKHPEWEREWKKGWCREVLEIDWPRLWHHAQFEAGAAEERREGVDETAEEGDETANPEQLHQAPPVQQTMQDECAICFFQTVNTILSCGHSVYCKECIEGWVRSEGREGRARDCPLCKGPIYPMKIVELVGLDHGRGEGDDPSTASGSSGSDEQPSSSSSPEEPGQLPSSSSEGSSTRSSEQLSSWRRCEALVGFQNDGGMMKCGGKATNILFPCQHMVCGKHSKNMRFLGLGGLHCPSEEYCAVKRRPRIFASGES